MSTSLTAALRPVLSKRARRLLRPLRGSRALGLGKAAIWSLRGEPTSLTRDRGSGGWLHRYPDGVLVTPHPVSRSWRQVEAITHDVFLRQYVPGEGDAVLEVGAGCGSETVTLARLVGPTGRVVAVEAH